MTQWGGRDPGVKDHPWVSGLPNLVETHGDAICDGETLVWERSEGRADTPGPGEECQESREESPA